MTKKISTELPHSFAIVLLVAAMIVGPLLIIWAINVLMGPVIQYSFSAWAAVLVLWMSLWGAT